MLEKQIEMLNNYFNMGNGGDIWYIKNLDKKYFLVNDDSEYQDFINFLKEIGTTWEEFKKEYEIEDIDYWESYFICEGCGDAFYMNQYGIQSGYSQDHNGIIKCNDCIDWDMVIEYYTNEPSKAINTNYEDIEYILKDKGFELKEEYDFHMETRLKPQDITKEFEKDFDYIWLLTSSEMFGCSSKLFLKKDS